MTPTIANLVAWGVQVALITVAAAAVSRFVDIDAPVIRYAWWRGVLVICLALPVFQPWQRTEVQTAAAGVIEATTTSTSREQTSAGALVAAPRGLANGTLPRLPQLVVAAIALGGLFRLAWLTLGLWRLRGLRGAGELAEAGDAPDQFKALGAAGAEIRYVASLRQPVTFGLSHPIVLLPERLRTMPGAVQRAVLAHELWHVERGDWAWSLAEEALCAILWFHPSVRYLVSRIQGAREEVVDELSILLTNARRSYVEALLAFADEPAMYPAAPFAQRRQLFTRMMLISKEAVMSSKRLVASTAGMAGALVATAWCGVLAFPLTATTLPATADRPAAQSQAPPRDPRAGVARPASARERELQAASSADPTNVTNWIEIAKLQEQREALAEAEATFTSAIAATSESHEVVMATAAFFTRTGQFEKAITALEESAARRPQDPAGYHQVSISYMEEAQKDPALTQDQKLAYVDRGIAASDRALALRSDYTDALVYKNILLRMKAGLVADSSLQQRLIAEAEELRGRAMELTKARTASAAPSVVSGSAPPPPPPPPPSDPMALTAVDGQQPVRVGGNIATPKKIRHVSPVYPPEAMAARITGVVILEALIDAQGAVSSAKILRSIPLLDEAALEAVRQWQFEPTLLNGVPVPVIMTVTVNFALQ
ncbi:MAG: TonB family protein [Vicinamibacterales bacterium]